MDHKEMLLQAGFTLSGEETGNRETTRSAWNSAGHRARAMLEGNVWRATCGGRIAVGHTSCEALYNALELRYGISSW